MTWTRIPLEAGLFSFYSFAVKMMLFANALTEQGSNIQYSSATNASRSSLGFYFVLFEGQLLEI